MTTREIYKCFISSPGDCEEERKICEKVIEELNKGLAKHLNINFESFMWEYDVLPDMGKNGQEIIDEHIKDSNYDIFIGIMKNRYGQPTKKAGSGTEHEFNDALLRKGGNSQVPQILFFFGKEMVDPDKFDKEQYDKVKEFKNKVRGLGIYTDFDNITTFKELLKNQLELFIKQKSSIENAEQKVSQVDGILKKLESDLEESLKSYNEKSPIWIDPIISSKKEIPNNPSNNGDYRIEIKSIIESPNNIIIKAPSEFGLTSLAHYMKLEAWKVGKIFLYIDAKTTKKHKIVKDINQLIENDYLGNFKKIDCILLDSICIEENGIMQMIKNVCDEFLDIPIIIFNTIENNFFLKSDEDDKVEIKRPFQPLYLLPLQQNDVRKIVVNYSRQKLLEEDDDIILNKVTKDLEVLNLHRTPKNCISILRASSKIGSNYSPVNRTRLLDIILNTIFEEYEIPTYHNKKPDIKDCSFVLGYLCEVLTLRNDFEFSEDFFKSTLSNFCKENFIELDLTYLLNILVNNSIIGKNYNSYYFKNSYWVFYFLAHRMNMSKDFLEKIYTDKKYIDFPEIIEFYTGIDRNKADALETLNRDIEETLFTIRNKVKIPDINPFKSISWNPDVKAMEKEEAKFSEDIISSGLPDEVKDKYDDRNYNQIRPYNQVINSVMRDYSFLVLMRQISAASRALRNSDYVTSNIKTKLLDKIMQSWNEINKLLIVLSPLLADKGNVAFEGAQFHLIEEDFSIQNPDLKRLAVLLAVPTNVVKFFKDDLFSSKMGPLLINRAKTENNSLIKHELMLLLIAERPQNWRDTIDNYIVSLDKNSFYLSDILLALNFNIDYKATEAEDIRILKFLSRKCRAKHLFKENNPSLGLMNRLI
jgi:ser/thr phosphatase family protein